MPARKGNETMKNKGGTFFKLRNLRNIFRGGAGVAEHGINAFGGIGQQRPMSANDNTIAMKQVSGGSRKGGSMVVDVGAPLVLTGLNHYMKRRSVKKGGGKCSLKGGKKVRMGGKSKKIMKKGKWGGKRRSTKKRSGKKMKGAAITQNTDKVGDDDDDYDDYDDDNLNGGGDENHSPTLPPGVVSGGGHENHSPTLPPVTN